MKDYDPLKIEKKWQDKWAKKKVYKTKNNSKDIKLYVLDMFPYPSGTGLHVGHPKGYIGSDVYARMKRMQGMNVLHPMGYDAFGLPAEQYALEHNIHPRKAVEENIKTFEKQLSIIGLSYDWERKVNTTDPDFYKWTQWIFLKLYDSWYGSTDSPRVTKKARPISELVKHFEKDGNRYVNAVTDNTVEFSAAEWKSKTDKEKQDMLMKYRLAYEGYSDVNWSPKLGTVLANDEVVDGPNGPVSERGGFPVEKKKMRQWFLRITAYADRLISGLEDLNWSESIKEIQRNWIGKSEGAEIEFPISNFKPASSAGGFPNGESAKVKVFTTRADTLFGATYVVLAPEHPLISNPIAGEAGLRSKISNWNEVEKYIRSAKNKPTEERTAVEKEKTGIRLEGVTAINPANGEEVPVWIADYVLADYGTGAIMAVPGHDERDFEFAKKYNLPIKIVIEPETGPILPNEQHRRSIVAIVEDKKNKKFLTLNWGPKLGGTLFIGGGREEGEDEVTTAKREIQEETGFTNIKFLGKTELMHHHYFAFSKNVARNIEVIGLHFELLNNEKAQKDLQHDEKGNFQVEWLTQEDIFKKMEDENHLLSFRRLVLGEIYSGKGILTASGKFNGMDSEKAKLEITKEVGGKIVTKYKMRDAVFARQRYWGEPIPLVHDKNGMIKPLLEKSLPLKLPEVKSYMPTGTGESPLAAVSSWVKNGLETNTMPGWAGSSWYFLRYMDPKNKKTFADKKAINYWRNVDMYVGGSEHATGHLLYSRFWYKFLKDYDLVVTEEPFQTLKNQGMILGPDNRKMSKRWGNVINPNDIVKNYGADTLRLYEMFMGPFEASLPWSTDNIIGSRRFLDRVWRITDRLSKKAKSKPAFEVILHKTIKKVGDDINDFAFNTAISAMMILLNEMESAFAKGFSVTKKDFELFLKILSPFAPHITEEIWSSLGHKGFLVSEPWPKADRKKMEESEVKIVIQINGKVRAEANIAKGAKEDEVVETVKSLPDVEKWIMGKEIKKVIYVKDKLVNFVV